MAFGWTDGETADLIDLFDGAHLGMRGAKGQVQFFRAPSATGNPVIDTLMLQEFVQSAGAGARIILPNGYTYVLGREITLLDGQVLLGSFAKLKAMDQVQTTLTATLAMGNSVFYPIYVVKVASTSGFFKTQRVTFHDATTGGQVSGLSVKATVVDVVDSTTLRVQVESGIGGAFGQTMPSTAPYNEVTFTSYTWPVGTYLVSVTGLLAAPFGQSRNGFADLELNGNSGNNPLGNRWEVGGMVDMRADRSTIDNLYGYNSIADGVVMCARWIAARNIWLNDTNSMGFHIGASSGSTGGMLGVMRNLYVDSPGKGSPMIGHIGGYTSSHPAYPCLGFSRLTDHMVFDGLQFTNNNGSGSTWGQAIGCITGSDNYALSFSNLYISGFNKGIGPIQVVRSGAAAPLRLDFDNLHMENCGPTNSGSFNQWEVSSIGCSSGLTPHADQVRFRNCDFLDSPLIIQDANVRLENVFMKATAAANTASLIVIGTSTSTCRVDMSNVHIERPVGSNAGQPTRNEYLGNLYVQTATVRGDNVRCYGGTNQARIQSGSDLEVSNMKFEEYYNYGLAVFSASTRVVLNTPRAKLSSGNGAASNCVALDFNNGGGAPGAGAYIEVNNPSIEAVTTQAGQMGIRMCPTAAVPCTVTGGKVKVSGTSTQTIVSGGASGVGHVQSTLLNASWTPGASEVNNSVVNANA